MGSRLNHAVELAELGQLPLLKPNSHLVLLSLGPANTRSTRQVIEGFGQNVETTRCSTWHIRFGGLNTTGDSQVVQLPLSENSVNEPLLLLFDDLAKVQFRFELFVKNKCSKDNSAGVGVALLSTLREGRSQGRESLLRDCTIPLVDNESGSVVASLTFNYFVVHAYNGQRSTQCKDVVHGFWKEGGPTQVVGHRGSGANTTARTNLQLGENTLESLSSAAALGACGVEFDVQLTKDLIPVIYHNFLVMETGGETTIWNLKQDQFLHLSESQGPTGPLTEGAATRYSSRNGNGAIKPRSGSTGIYDDSRTTAFVDRLRHTNAARTHGLKGNLRGLAIQSLFPTFEELLTKLPESVAFNIEMKYPMLWEAQDQDWEPYAIEANVFVDMVLDLVYKYGGRRNITFSSFSPEISIALKAKQRDYPILFISKSGFVPTGDLRASNVEQAVVFAKRWDLTGVVLVANTLVKDPSLIPYIKSAGLICASYGDVNDDPENARIQAEAGLDAIIVNKVRLISQTLGAERKTV